MQYNLKKLIELALESAVSILDEYDIDGYEDLLEDLNQSSRLYSAIYALAALNVENQIIGKYYKVSKEDSIYNKNIMKCVGIYTLDNPFIFGEESEILLKLSRKGTKFSNIGLSELDDYVVMNMSDLREVKKLN